MPVLFVTCHPATSLIYCHNGKRGLSDRCRSVTNNYLLLALPACFCDRSEAGPSMNVMSSHCKEHQQLHNIVYCLGHCASP